jgi:hypothetical protein
LCFCLLIWQRKQKQHGSSVVEARQLQHSVSSGSRVAALAEQQRQRGSGAVAAGSVAEASAAQGQCWQSSGGGDSGGGSSAAVSSGEAGLQGSSNGGGRTVAFICTSFAVYEFIFCQCFNEFI